MLPSQRALDAAVKAQAWSGLHLCCPHQAQQGYGRQAEGLWAAARQGTSCRRPASAAVTCQAFHRNWRSMLHRGRRACLCRARPCGRSDQTIGQSPGLHSHPLLSACCKLLLTAASVDISAHCATSVRMPVCMHVAASVLQTLSDRGGTALVHLLRCLTAKHARQGVIPCTWSRPAVRLVAGMFTAVAQQNQLLYRVARYACDGPAFNSASCRSHWAACLALGGVLCWQLHSFMQLLGHQNATYLEAGLAAALLVILPFVAPSQVGTPSCLVGSPCLDLLSRIRQAGSQPWDQLLASAYAHAHSLSRSPTTCTLSCDAAGMVRAWPSCLCSAQSQTSWEA